MNGDNLSPEVVLTADVGGYQRNLRAAEQQTNSLLDSVNRLSEGIMQMHRTASRDIMLVGAGATAGIVGATAAAGRFQAQMEQLEASSVMTNRSLDVTRNRVNSLRGDFSITTNEAVGLVTQLNKMGQGGRPVEQLAGEFIKLSAVTGESLPALTSSMVTLQRQMGTEGVQNTRNYSATLASLSEQAGVSAQGILDFSNAIAPVSDMAGMTQREVMGFSTAFNKAGQDGFAAASMYNRMVMDITRSIQQGGPELQGYANLLGVSVEQMKQIPVAESVERIFEEITKEGPRAVAILEQLGFEGVRSYRSAVAVAQRGGIRQSMQQAHQPADTEKFAEAAERAMGGLNDQFQIFQNNLTRTGQAIGATFLPAAEKMMGVLATLAQTVAGATEMAGNIPGIGLAAAAGGVLAGGALLRAVPMLGIGAMGAMVARSSAGAGWRTAGPNATNAPEWARRQAAQMAAGDPRIGPTQRFLFNAGTSLRGWVGDHMADAEGRPRGLGRAVASRAAASSAMGSAIHLGGYLYRSALKPLEPQNLENISSRDQIRGGPEWAQRLQRRGGEQFDAAARSREQAVANYRAYRDQGMAPGTAAANAARDLDNLSRSARSASDESARYATATRAARTEIGRMATSTVRAGAGAALWTAGAAGAVGSRAAGFGLRGLGALGSSALGLVGGPVGLLAMGGIGGYMAHNMSEARGASIRQNVEDYSVANQYETALGLASKATVTFAEAVNQARDDILGADSETGEYGTRPLTAEDTRRVTSPAFQYTTEAFAGMTDEEVARTLSLNLPGLDNEARGAMIADALKKVGSHEAVNEMLEMMAPDVSGGYADIGSDDRWYQKIGGSLIKFRTDQSQQQANEIASSVRRLQANVPEEYRDAALLAPANQAFAGLWEGYTRNAWRGTRSGALRSGLDAVAQQMGHQDEESIEELTRLFHQTSRANTGFLQRSTATGDEFAEQLMERLLEGDSPLARSLQDAVEQGVDPRTFYTGDMARQIEERPYADWGGEDFVKILQDTRMGGRLMPEAPVSLGNLDPVSLGTLRWRGEEGQAAKGVSEAIDFAMRNPSNQGAQEAAAWKLASEGADAMGTSGRDAARALHEFRDAINTATNPLYQILTQAQMMQRGEEDYALLSRPTAERYQTLRDRRVDAEQRWRENPDAIDAFPMYWADRQAELGAQEEYRQRVTGIVRGGREMDIAIEQQNQDYEREKGWSDFDFNLGRERQLEDFNRARQLQDEARERSVNRAWRDFNLQRNRAEYEFFLGRERQEESYARQLSRSWRDFNISRERGQYEFDLQRSRGEYDYNLQRQRAESDFDRQRKRNQHDFDLNRRRQEEDFNHQLVLLAEQSARQMYNVYERVQVQRTLSGQNLLRNMEDQARRLQEQQDNLQRAREMGLSDEAIRMLGLNEAANAQQLARLMRELTPEMIAQLNQGIGDRIDLGGDLFMDPANQQYAEMVRQFELQRERAAEDFQRGMDRSREDFQRGMAHMREDYLRALSRSAEDFERMRGQQRDDFLRSINDQRQEMDIQMAQSLADFRRMRDQQHTDFMTSLADMQEDYDIQTREQERQFDQSRQRQLDDYNRHADRAVARMEEQQQRMRDSFNRSHEEIFGDINDLAKEAMDHLDGATAEQMQAMMDAMETTEDKFTRQISKLVDRVKGLFDSFGINNVWISGANQGGADPTRNVMRAEGGPIPGSSPHPKADNIPIWATAGEFMQPVATVQHYGVDIMEKMRKRELPKEAFEGYAEGGLIAGLWGRRHKKPVLESYGRDLQERGYHVGEHPKFGGVHPTAHLPTSKGGLHYIGHAIDVNYDGNGQAYENRMIDRIIHEIEARGLGYIWRSAGHYGHIHIDTSPYRQLNGRLLSFDERGGMDIRKDPKSGLEYLHDIYKEIVDTQESKDMEALFDLHQVTKSRYQNRSLQKMISVRALDELMADIAPEHNEPFNVPGGVERWRPLVLRALGMVGQHSSLADITLRRMNQESSGNPRAINLWDSNAKRGTPSKGLMQVIDPTFRAYAMRGYDQDIWDPLSNVLASMRYALSRYGGLHTAYARPGGYAEGGLINWHGEGGIFTEPSRIGVAERGPEMVLPLYGRGVEFLREVLHRSSPDYREHFVRRDGVPEVSKQIVYNSSYDHSTHYHGQIVVQSQDPDEMQRKLEAKKRQNALIGRR